MTKGGSRAHESKKETKEEPKTNSTSETGDGTQERGQPQEKQTKQKSVRGVKAQVSGVAQIVGLTRGRRRTACRGGAAKGRLLVNGGGGVATAKTLGDRLDDVGEGSDRM